jgi:hypothetical protein
MSWVVHVTAGKGLALELEIEANGQAAWLKNDVKPQSLRFTEVMG